MAWPLLRWFRRDRRGNRAPVVENRSGDAPGHILGDALGDETMLLTTGLRLPDPAGRAAGPLPAGSLPAGSLPAASLPAGAPGDLPATPPGSAFLVVHHGPQAGARFLLSEAVTGVGRGPRQDILLDDATVSRAHAEFVRCDDGFMVRDLNSLNGTYVGAERVAEAVLHADDVIRIGKFRLVYHPGPRPDAAPSAEGDESPTPSAR